MTMRPSTIAALCVAGVLLLRSTSFASGGAEDTHYLTIVYEMIMQKVRRMPSLFNDRAHGKVAVYFVVDKHGHIARQSLLTKSGDTTLDRLAMKAVREAAPFPPPPSAASHGLVWENHKPPADGPKPLDESGRAP